MTLQPPLNSKKSPKNYKNECSHGLFFCVMFLMFFAKIELKNKKPTTNVCKKLPKSCQKVAKKLPKSCKKLQNLRPNYKKFEEKWQK
jgi:hypothetical protein